MDYILQHINKKISFHGATNNSREVAEYLRLKIEYCLILALSYLWNEKFDQLEQDAKTFVFEKVQQPSIGSIIDVCRRLDTGKELFANKKFLEAVNRYPVLRNDRIGHGYTFLDQEEILIANLHSMANAIQDSTPLFRSAQDLVLVLSEDDSKFMGINYKSDGVNYKPWACPKQINKDFNVGSVYLFAQGNNYYRTSPFVHITADEEFYLFRSVEEILSGRVRYNKLFRTGDLRLEWNELSNTSIESTTFRRRSPNGTIVSILNKNYKKYIEVGVLKKKIVNFLTRDKASVCATVWGHGGVGKTATVQSICDDLANDNHKKFDYIAFVSAKDRFYDYYKGVVQSLEGSTSTFEGLVRGVNQVLFNEDSDDVERIVNIKNKALIVIDDYETFALGEKLKIENFIRSLNINHHKVIVTTRANLIIGDEYQTNELDPHETRSFLVEILRSEFNRFHVEQLENELNTNNRYLTVHEITSGRPLFVYQFAYMWMQSGTIESALTRNIKQEKHAIDFLYGRIYDYLSLMSKDIFVVIGQIVTEDDLTNLIDKVKYILNLEGNDKFQDGIRDLEKLRIIEVLEGKFFRVYSKEILQAMSTQFAKRNDSFRGSVIRRLQHVTKDKGLDNDSALLHNANTARVSRSEEEVISLYRNVINRANSNIEVRMQAVFNLSDYLFNSRGKKDEAVKLFKDYEHLFNEEAAFTRLHALYCWTTGRSQESIEILSDFCARKPRQYREDRSVKFELLGLLVMYRSISAIQKKEELKEMRRFNEIDQTEYLTKTAEVRALFVDICTKHGSFFVHDLKQMDDVETLTSGARQNVIAGLYQYVNVNIRLNRYQEAINTCEFVIQKFPTHFSDQFTNKVYFCRSKL